MLVYNYASASALEKILQGRGLGFSLPDDLNDLFDRPRVERSRYPQVMQTLFDGQRTAEEMAQAEDASWGTCAIGSFTRTHDNALMWAHYADGHGGVVDLDAHVAGPAGQGLSRCASAPSASRPNGALCRQQGLQLRRHRLHHRAA